MHMKIPSFYFSLSFGSPSSSFSTCSNFFLSDQVREMYITFQLLYLTLQRHSPQRGLCLHFPLLSSLTYLYSPAMAKPPSALASAWGSHTHFSQHSPGTWTLRGMGQSGPGSITSTLQRGMQPICPSRHIHWYLQLGKKVCPF